MARYRRRLDPDSTSGPDAGLDEEIETHLALRTAELVASGMSGADARAEAERRFGDPARARRRLKSLDGKVRRRRRLAKWTDGVLADFRLAARRATRSPAFSLLSVVVFAVGVGLSTAMFTLADHVLLRPLPLERPDELVALLSVPERGEPFPWVSMTNWSDWRGAAGLAGTALYTTASWPVSTESGAFFVEAAAVAGPFFATVGMDLVLGRATTEEEAQSEADLVVVSEGFWGRVLGAPPTLDGVGVTVNGTRRRVVGVVRDRAGFPGGVELWVPLPWRAGSGAMRNNINFQAVARLAPGVTPDRVDAELDAIARGIREREPEALYSWGVGVSPLRDVVTRDARTPIVLLGTSVGFLLLVACANLAGLGLARARRRDRDVAVHLALGAPRSRLVRRAVTEHVLLASAGGGCGVALAALGTRILAAEAAGFLPRTGEIHFDARVAAFGIVASLAAGLLAGLLPAILGSRGDLSAVLSGARGGIRGGRGLPGAGLVAAEVALAVALLVGGGLLFRSFRSVLDRDLGFGTEGVVVVQGSLIGPDYVDAAAHHTFWETVRDAAASRPGVHAAGLSSAPPTLEKPNGFIEVEGSAEEEVGALYTIVDDGYFDVLGVPVVRGRGFDASDGPGTERVAVVNEAMARRYWGGSPLGHRVRAVSLEGYASQGRAPWITVVGVVPDMRSAGYESTAVEEMFVLYRQVPWWRRSMTLLARSGVGATAPLVEGLRETMREADAGVPIEVTSLASRLADLTVERRTILAGLGVFATGALLLVCLGVYGLMAYAAGERTREMAVRTALGADRPGVIGLMLREALRVVGAGVAGGLVAAWAFSRLLASLLVDVAPTDPLTYLGAASLLTGVALLAAVVPSLRVARTDPVEALRADG